jgi:acyl carrier protein
MTEDEVREKVLAILQELAPGLDVHTLKPDVRLRDQLDLDSMDFLNFLIGVDEQLGVDIPEADYPRLAKLNDIYGYLLERRTAPTPLSSGRSP